MFDDSFATLILQHVLAFSSFLTLSRVFFKIRGSGYRGSIHLPFLVKLKTMGKTDGSGCILRANG